MARETKVGLAVIAVGLALGLLGDDLFWGQPFGLNVLLLAVAFVLGLSGLLWVCRAPMHHGRRWMVAPLLIFAAAFLWHDSTLLVATNVTALAGAIALAALRRTAPKPTEAGVVDYAAGLAASGAAAFAGSVQLLRSDIGWDEVGRGARSERTVAVGKGVAVAIPLLALFGGLFVAADAVFKSFVVGALPSSVHPLLHVLVVLVLAWLSAGLLRDLIAAREDQRLLSPHAVVARKVPFRLGGTEIAVALGVLNLLFLAFVLVQVRYLFGGGSMVQSRAHLTYAQYARHGFFELVAASVLVLPVLLGAQALLRRETARSKRRAVALLSTPGRGRLFAVGALVCGFATTGVLNVLDPDALIARTNLSRPNVDIAYLAGLSDDAVPTLVARLPDLKPEARRWLARALLLRHEDGGDWRGWNVARSRASRVIDAHRTELQLFSR